MNQRTDVITKVIAMTDYSNGMYGGDRLPDKGQMVVTGPHLNAVEKRIGFCVQIRKGCGQFGSDMVFLRHPDESLTTHENQAYFAMTEDQERFARTLFTHLPEDEDYSEGYRCGNKVHELGFFIDHSESTPIPNTPFNLRVSNGVSKTLVAHIG